MGRGEVKENLTFLAVYGVYGRFWRAGSKILNGRVFEHIMVLVFERKVVFSVEP